MMRLIMRAANPKEEMATRRLIVNGRKNCDDGSFNRQNIKQIIVISDCRRALLSVGLEV